jgi:hypothetical protein
MNDLVHIGLVGLAGSGKDTAASILCSKLNYKIVSFAEELKRTCLFLGWDGNKDIKGRKLLQDVGMAFREYSEDTWVKITCERLLPNVPHVFSDVRFLNEAEYIKNKLNGIVVRIVRNDLALTEAHEHISETGQIDLPVDYTISNDSTIDSLQQKLLQVVETVQHHKKNP